MIHHLNLLRFSNQRDAYIELIALTWVGRGDLAPRNFEETIAERRNEHFNVDYLVNKSPIRAHIETGLWALGYESSPKPEWIAEYERMRRLHGDPDYPPLPCPAPAYTIDQFNTAPAAPLWHVSIGDVLDCIALGWQAEEKLMAMSVHARIEIFALFDYGRADHAPPDTWTSALETSMMFYNADATRKDGRGMDTAVAACLSQVFPEYLASGLTRLGLLDLSRVKDELRKRR